MPIQKVSYFVTEGMLYINELTVLYWLFQTSKRTIPFLFDRGDGEFLRPCGLCESSGGAFGNSTSTSFSLDKQAVGF